ncbi:small integral membrane protein 29-like isoform X2 [Syngnathus acus]|uniref:small integral membrane protein 29-like isoform X2 n=1 Tax=Syngnathus acus TaxID=161584 RepID=UPI001886391D|nr:small integral membrane protein 29-like isoform X2 [Syngnathus acus]
MYYNHSVSPANTDRRFIGYYALVPLFFHTALVVFMKKRMRLDELRHRLIPVYSYDPAEDQWVGDELESDDELKVREREGVAST